MKSNVINSFPQLDGFHMPAEFNEHSATIMIFPERAGSWGYGAKAAQKAFTQIINEISHTEKVYILASDRTIDLANSTFSNNTNVTVLNIDSDDAWARDTAPTFVVNDNGELRAVDWQFNAWGGEYDGLYASWDKDDKIPQLFCERLGIDRYNARPFVLEGGSIHSDGDGTILVTEECLLSKGRNPQLSKAEIEDKLKKYLGAEKIIWLPRGIYNDETNGHIDNICAFVAPAEVVLAWTDNMYDVQYEISAECLKVLESETDAKGRPIKVHKLPVPSTPICITESDLNGYVFEEGEDEREIGERLAASYVNFYFCNGAILLPQFEGDNTESDKAAVEILQNLCPDRRVIPIPARDILLGGGNIHCITQQIPKYDITKD